MKRIALARNRLVLVGGLVVMDAGVGDAIAGERTRVIAAVGGQPPGMSEGSRYVRLSFHQAAINEVGESAFHAVVSEPARHLDDYALFADNGQSARLVVRTGQPDLRLPGLPVGSFLYPSIDDWAVLSSGRVAFRTHFGDGQTFLGHGVWVEAPEGFELVTMTGAPGSEFPGDQVEFISSIAMLPRDSLQVSGDATNGASIWRAAAKGLAPLVRSGWPAPGLDPGVSFLYAEVRQSPLDALDASNDGRAVFSATLAGPNVDESNDESAWLAEESGLLVLVAREGEKLSTGGVLASPVSAGVDRNGAIRVISNIVAADGTVRTAFLSWEAGELTAVISEGDPAPEFGEGATIDVLLGGWYRGDDQLLLLLGIRDAQGMTRHLLSTLTGRDRRCLARPGTRIPTHGPTSIIRRLEWVAAESAYMMFWHSPGGRIAFAAKLAEADAAPRFAICGIDRVGRIRVVGCEGDVIEIRPGEFRTLSRPHEFVICDAGVIVTRWGTSGGGVVLSTVLDCPSMGCDLADVARNDCRVDISDLAIVLANFDVSAGEGDYVPGDADLNGSVDVSDLTRVLVSFGLTCSGE